MMNFLLGTLAGGIIACVATIAAARHPDVQARLGLVPVQAPPMAATPTRPETRCPVVPRAEPAAVRADAADLLFSPKRFWFVAP